MTRSSFRANPAYELIPFHLIPFAQQSLLGYLREDPSHYGILQPRRGADLGAKAVDRDTAQLYRSLLEPGPLPPALRDEQGPQAREDVARLVLDGILEIEVDGSFRSGAAAYDVLYTTTQSLQADGAIAALSLAALQYAQALGIRDPLKLAARLYFYNRIPVTPTWRAQFPGAAATLAALGLHSDATLPGTLSQRWRPTSTSPNGWLMWRARRQGARRARAAPVFKLYVSPDPRAIRDALHTSLDVLARHADQLKVGQDVYGLLRPDKIVAYFQRYTDLIEAATRLGAALAGCPAHGVPFTAALAAGGLLSWGIDPPAGAQLLPWQTNESWRVWVAHRLSTALIAAQDAPGRTVQPWQFALERLQLEGIQTATWTPETTLWQDSIREVR